MYCVKQKSLAICHQVIQRKGDSGGGVVTTARSGRLSKKVMYTLVAIMSATTVGGVFVRNVEKMISEPMLYYNARRHGPLRAHPGRNVSLGHQLRHLRGGLYRLDKERGERKLFLQSNLSASARNNIAP